MIVAVDQPNYLPWKGYFDLIHDVDLFVFYNDVQYTVRDWRSRNRIMTPDGLKWLSVPAGSNRNRLICEVKLEDKSWQKKHLETIRFAYSKAPFFSRYFPFFEEVYLGQTWDYLFELNQFLTVAISREFLGIKTRFADSRNFPKQGMKHEKMLSLMDSLGNVDIYESGPAAKDYIIPEDYEKKGIELVWKNYEGYPEYPQLSKEFTHQVSIIDLLFNVGDEAPYYIWGWRKDANIPAYTKHAAPQKNP